MLRTMIIITVIFVFVLAIVLFPANDYANNYTEKRRKQEHCQEQQQRINEGKHIHEHYVRCGDGGMRRHEMYVAREKKLLI